MGIEKVLKLYGIETPIIDKLSESDDKAVWTINDKYILKRSDNEEEMAKNIKITTMLINHNIPVQKNMESLSGQAYVEYESKFYVLYKKIKGQTITDYFRGNYAKRAYYIGQCIAKMHIGLKKIYEETPKDKMNDNYMIDEIKGWAHTEIEKLLSAQIVSKHEAEEFKKLYKFISSDFETLYNTLPRQLVHRDMHGENMIFDGDEFKGFIDFDLSQVNARIYDPCYMCTAALSTVFDKEDDRKKWTHFVIKLIKGYDEIIELTENEKKSIKPMMIMNQIIMTAFFYKYGYHDIAYTNLKMTLYIDEVFSE